MGLSNSDVTVDVCEQTSSQTSLTLCFLYDRCNIYYYYYYFYFTLIMPNVWRCIGTVNVAVPCYTKCTVR